MHRPRLSPAQGRRCGPPPPPPPRILSYTPAAAPLHLKTILSRPHIRSLATVPFFCSSFLAKPFKEFAVGALQKAPLFLFSLEPTPIRPGPLPSILDKITRGLACPAKGPVLGPHKHFASRHCAAWPIRRSLSSCLAGRPFLLSLLCRSILPFLSWGQGREGGDGRSSVIPSALVVSPSLVALMTFKH